MNEVFNLSDFREGQDEIIDSIISKNNTIAVLPTGGGKSICYQIPALLGNNFSVVVSPLISLMKDQVDNLNSKKNIACYINSSMNSSEIFNIFSAIKNNEIKLIYISPERLENKLFVEQLVISKPDYIFVDEAHCISQWGNNFRPSYLKISEFARKIGVGNISAFTATATPKIIEDIKSLLNLDNPKIFIKGYNRDNLKIEVIQNQTKKNALIEILSANPRPAIVYASTRKNVEDISFFLNQLGIDNEYYHAGVNTFSRKKIQDDFINGKSNIIIATNAFGMGIDKRDIRTVIHYNIPLSIENYYQEIGRAGRDGEIANIFTIYNDEDNLTNLFLINSQYPNLETVRKIYDYICDSVSLSLGSAYSAIIGINVETFNNCYNTEFTFFMIQNCLLELEKQGIIKIFHKNSNLKLRINSDTNYFQKFLKNEADFLTRDIFVEILKNHSYKPFVEDIFIDVEKLAKKIGNNSTIVLNKFIDLNSQGIVEIQRNNYDFNIKILSERINSAKLDIDISRINKLKEHALTNYKKMQELMFTNKCRMQFIVNYFGDSTYRNCGKCDNCTDKSIKKSLEYLKYIVNQTLEIEPNLDSKEVVDILKGKYDNKFFPTYELGKNYSEQEILLQLDKIVQKPVSSKVYLFNPDDLVLLKLLQVKRSDIARKYIQKNEMICPDNLLLKIAKIKPQTELEFLCVKGMTQRRFHKCGKEFLELINDYVEKKSS